MDKVVHKENLMYLFPLFLLIYYNLKHSLSFVSLYLISMAAHSNTLAWQIPWTGEPGRLQSMGSRRVRHD